VLDLNIYAVENRGARLVSGPSLFKDITSRDVSERDDLRLSLSEIAWTGPSRFVLKERRSFMISNSDSGFTHMLGFHGSSVMTPVARPMISFWGARCRG
jgi:hypothetical protein